MMPCRIVFLSLHFLYDYELSSTKLHNDYRPILCFTQHTHTYNHTLIYNIHSPFFLFKTSPLLLASLPGLDLERYHVDDDDDDQI
jgi:hypothetical protein